ncbi:MAG TPA: glycosyltransferase, partial [Mycobacteriales bacterium]|nr:glycosyltransferase [Mycobacteriales bacterium]
MPPRLLRLTGRGTAVADALLAGFPVTDAADATVARRLVQAGLAHSLADGAAAGSITALVPVHARIDALARCLATLDVPAVVVADGSPDLESIRRICAEYGARLVLRAVRGGPAAARNSGLDAIETELVAFVDSDVIVPPGALARLAAHFHDPHIVAAAPRVRPARAEPRRRAVVLARYLADRSPLDLGDQPARVRPGGAVGYLPTACLLVRREAVGSFDDRLRYGEDVDLVWRLTDAGGDVRYDPSIVVRHAEPSRWGQALWRRLRYGSSAGPLARRHPGRLASYRATPLPALGALAAVTASLPIAASAGIVTVAATAYRLRQVGLPPRASLGFAGRAVQQAATGLGHYATGVGLPFALAALALPGHRGRRAGRLAALAVIAALQ